MKRISLLGAALALAGILWAGDKSPSNNRKSDAPATAIARTKPEVDGDAAYKANCSRCHMPPHKFSARETQTIMMHMRARANLTAAEQKAILKYLTD